MLGGLTACLLALAAASPAIAAEASPIVSIDLPIPNDSDVEAHDDGSLHFASASTPEDDVFVQQLEDGSVRSLTTIPSADAATSFVFPVELAENQQLTSTSDGGVVIAEEIANGDIVEVASAADPWAVDANGVNLPTWYEVTDSSIVQHVDVEGAAFPVLADPTFTRSGVKVTFPGYAGALASVYLNNSRSVDYQGGSTVICGVVGAILALGSTGIAAPVAALACAGNAGSAAIANNHGMCVAMDYRPANTPKLLPRYYKNSWCR